MAQALAAAIPAIASVASSLFSEHSSASQQSALQYKYQQKLNKSNYKYNVKLINLQNAFNEAMMDKANLFNESMMDKANQWNLDRWNESIDLSNTAHQREVSDLRKAGLNPVLSANGGAAIVNPIQSAQTSSAQTSSGNSQLSSSAGMPDVDYMSAVGTAMNMRNQYKMTNSQVSNLDANTDNVYNQMAINNKTSAASINKMKAETDEIKQNILNNKALTNAQIKQINSQVNLNNQNSARAHRETENLKLDSYDKQRHKEFLQSQGKIGRNVYNWIRGLNLSTSARIR